MPKYFEFDVALHDLSPRIWRRMLVRSSSTFADLHKAIQDGFGWQQCHLWEFRLPTRRGSPIAGPAGGGSYDRPMPDARHVKLSDYFTGYLRAEWCEYEYDFGDGWTHEVKLLAIHAVKETFKRRLLDGERNGPPEDCGGPPGYERMVAFVETGNDRYGEDPDHLASWLGEWRPDAFDLASAKARFDR